jgi:hypothetical protein
MVKTVQYKTVALTLFNLAHAGFSFCSYVDGESCTARMLSRRRFLILRALVSVSLQKR